MTTKEERRLPTASTADHRPFVAHKSRQHVPKRDINVVTIETKGCVRSGIEPLLINATTTEWPATMAPCVK